MVYYLVDTNGALSQVLAEYDDSSLITLYTRGEELISQERNGEKSYYLYDGFDSVRMLTDSEGVVTDTYTFDAFGNLVSSTGDTENSYLYRGEQYDSFTGLYYLRARYMNPSTGTFITMDEYAGSVFEPVSLHKYLYANANPVMYTDPTGYFTMPECITVVGIQNVLNSMACGACMGAMIGGMYSMLITALRGGTSAEIQQAFLDGMANGFISGAMFGGLGAFASVYWQAELMRSMCMFMGGYYAVQAAMLDFANGDYLAGILNLGIGLSCAYSSANSASRAGGMRQNAWLNQSGNYLNDSGINQQSEAPDLPEVIRNIYNAERTGSALKNDVYHRAGSYLTENQLAQGKANYFVGGDGVTRILFQVEGGVNGHSGIFEYILEPNGTVSHQIFYPNGHFTDLPNSQ